MNYNKVILVGRLVREPETVMLSSGSQVSNLVLAYNRNYKTQEGTWKEESHFFEIKVFGRLAERVVPQLGKGDLILVEGRLHQDKWNDKETGEPRSKIRVVALDIKILSKVSPKTQTEGVSEIAETPEVKTEEPVEEDLEKLLFGEEEENKPEEGKKKDDLDDFDILL